MRSPCRLSKLSLSIMVYQQTQDGTIMTHRHGGRDSEINETSEGQTQIIEHVQLGGADECIKVRKYSL